jgi:hypothetical protein
LDARLYICLKFGFSTEVPWITIETDLEETAADFGAAAGAVGDSAGLENLEKCIKRFATNARRNVKFLSSQQKANLSIVRNVIRRRKAFSGL